MGRRKLEMKRIEDKSSRQVTFSKRRGGLIKKARQLSVLCDVDVAVVIFSGRGKLYEFCSGGSSVAQILSRHRKCGLEAEAATGTDRMELPSRCTKFRTCDELLQAVERLVDEPDAELTDTVIELSQLEEELDAALMQTRSRKTQLMIEYRSALNEKEKKLREENHQMQQQIASAKMNVNPDDGGGGLNDLATNRVNFPQLSTLQLFTE